MKMLQEKSDGVTNDSFQQKKRFFLCFFLVYSAQEHKCLILLNSAADQGNQVIEQVTCIDI